MEKSTKKFADKYPFIYDSAIVFTGVLAVVIVWKASEHFAKPLMASVMGTKTVATTTTASAATAAPVEAVGVTTVG